MIDAIFIFFQHHIALLDSILLLLGFSVGVFSRFRGVMVFLEVSILMVKMAKWYFQTHPHGIQHAKKTQIDEGLNKIYNDKLINHDVDNEGAVADCLGRG